MTALVLFNRDLRVDDHPALTAAAAEAARSRGPLVALFVLDDLLLRAPTMGANRVGYLLEALAHLRHALRGLGGELLVRRGDPVAEAVRLATAHGVTTIHASEDVTSVARRRERRLRDEAASAGIAVQLHPGVGTIEPLGVVPAGGDHYRVFTPFYRAWSSAPRRGVLPPPGRLPPAPPGEEPGRLPSLSELAAGGPGADPLGLAAHGPLRLAPASPRRITGGEAAALQRLGRFEAAGRPAGYGEVHDDLAADGTSHLSADLHFGCLSPRRLEAWADARGGAEEFVRQLCWREFHLQVAAAFPGLHRRDYRPRGREWRVDEAELEAWKAGETGVDLVDAAMVQLREEGWVHNRARLVAASYLTKTLGHHWREGADHYLSLLVDGDIPSNGGNWQWMAGTGNDTRPNRVLSPARQAARFDPAGEYRRRYAAPGGPAAAVQASLFDPSR